MSSSSKEESKPEAVADAADQTAAATTDTVASDPAQNPDTASETASAPTSTVASTCKRVYVGNLAWSVSWQDLKDHMKSTGLDVQRATILSSADGRSKGCGLVEFHTAEDAATAVSDLNDTELQGRPIFVREDREKGPSGGGGGGGGGGGSSSEASKQRRVYVGNLAWDVAWQDLKDHMRDAGEVVHAEVIREHTGRSKGCGIVEYATDEDAQNAIATLNDTELSGRMIFVREDRETGGASPSSRGGNPSVYVWNLSPSTTWQELKDHMRKAGNVDSATILQNTTGDAHCGVVVYQRPQEAMRAIRELQSSELNGQPISIREDRARQRKRVPGGGRGGGAGGRRRRSEIAVQVQNLSGDTTWRELKDHFRQCGDVAHTEVKGGGAGVVLFASKADAEAAVSRLDGSELQGNKLEVTLN